MEDDPEAIPIAALRCTERGKTAEPAAEGWKAYWTMMMRPSCSARTVRSTSSAGASRATRFRAGSARGFHRWRTAV